MDFGNDDRLAVQERKVDGFDRRSLCDYIIDFVTVGLT